MKKKNRCTIVLWEEGKHVKVYLNINLKNKKQTNYAQLAAIEMIGAHVKLMKSRGETIHAEAKVKKRKQKDVST